MALDVEPAVRSSLSSIPISPSLSQSAEGAASLHAQACAYATEGRIVKASKVMLDYLVAAAASVPVSDLKKPGSEILTVIESCVAAGLKAKKVTQAGKLIRVIEKAMEKGVITAQKRWHRIRLLHL